MNEEKYKKIAEIIINDIEKNPTSIERMDGFPSLYTASLIVRETEGGENYLDEDMFKHFIPNMKCTEKNQNKVIDESLKILAEEFEKNQDYYNRDSLTK